MKKSISAVVATALVLLLGMSACSKPNTAQNAVENKPAEVKRRRRNLSRPIVSKVF